ncbi:MAG TPA: L,D-transpeptidase [Cyanothece sp. UBA12306]|nr:L,D-transpeptidase [Cyanothece sp. UBA12306]
MKFNQSLLSISLACCAVFTPVSLLQRQAIAGEVSEPITSETTTPTLTPAISNEAAPAETVPPAETKVMATRLVLKLKERKVYAYQNDKVLASYPVAIGKKGWETPKGNFVVRNMVVNPKWKNPWNGKISAPGPNSPLGERWIGFATKGKNVIGFHGTPGEHVMGQAVSHGCVRMRNKDIKALYELVDKGIPVIVQ